MLVILTQEVLSDLADILAAEDEVASSGGGTGSEVSMGALTAAVHLLQWDQQVVSTPAVRRTVGNSARY